MTTAAFKTVRLPSVVVALLVLFTPAPGARAQDIPFNFETRTNPDAATMARVVDPVVDAFRSGDLARLSQARSSILERLSNPSVSVAFRLDVSDRLASVLDEVVDGPDAAVSGNALLIAGRLATDDASRVILKAFSSETVSVRYAAASAAGETIRAFGAPSPPLREPNARALVEAVVGLVGSDEDENVAASALRALSRGRLVDRGPLVDLARTGLGQGALAAGERLRGASQTEPRFVLGILSFLLETRGLLTDSVGNLPDEMRCSIADLAANAVAFVRNAYQRDGREFAGLREPMLQLLDAAEKTLYFTRIGLTQESGLAPRLRAGRDDEAFYRGVIGLIGPGGPMTQAPCRRPGDAYLK